MHGTGMGDGRSEPGDGLGATLARARAPSGAPKTHRSASPTNFTAVPAEYRRPQSGKPQDIGSPLGSAPRRSRPVILAAGRCPWGSNRSVVAIGAAVNTIARTHTVTGVMAP